MSSVTDPIADMLTRIRNASMARHDVVLVPTSRAKEAIAHYPEILKEIRLAVQECGRHLSRYISRRRRQADAERKRQYIERYIPHIGAALREILSLTERQEAKVVNKLEDILERSRKM